MPANTFAHTPDGWPYLDADNYLGATPDYTLELANNLDAVIGPAPGAVIDTGWVPVSLTSGHTGSIQYRVVRGVAEVIVDVTRTAGNFTTTFVEVGVLPVLARPSGGSRDFVVLASTSAGSAPARINISVPGSVLVRIGATAVNRILGSGVYLV